MRIRSPVLVGRDAELARLGQWLDEARAGRPRLVVIGGEAGIGKSRLLHELSVRAQAQGVRWLIGGAADYGAGGLPFGAVVEALRPAGYFDAVLPGAAAADGQGAARARPTDADPSLSLFEDLRALIERMCAEQPMVLALEDLHWADTSTREFLAYLARNLAAMRLLVLATYRSDDVGRDHPLRRYLTELSRGMAVERLDLGRLERDEVGEQVRAIRGTDPSAAQLERIFARSQGNPFFSEELLASSDDATAVPPSLRDMLLARTERLPAGSRAIVAALAVAVHADERLLADAAALSEEDVFGALRTAIDGQVVERSASGYVFRHALLREAVYDDLLPGEQARLHVRIAESLARGLAGATWDVQRLAQVAHHWQAGGRPREAIVAAWRAAQAAEKSAVYAEAALQYERLLELWPAVDDAGMLLAGELGQAVPADRVAVLMRAGRAADTAGELPRASAHFRAALEEIDVDSDVERAALATLGLVRATADGETASALINRALELVPRCSETVRLTVMTGLMQALILFGGDDVPLIARDLIATADASGDLEMRIRAYGAAGRAEAIWFDADAGLAFNDVARRLAAEAGDELSLAELEKDRATILQMSGRFTDGLAVMERSQAIARRLGGVGTVRHNDAEIGQMLYRLGRWAEAEAALDRALRPPAAEWGRVLRAQLLVGMGRFEEARADLAHAQPTVEKSGSSASLGPYHAALAEMAMWEGRPDDARVAIDSGLPLQREHLDMRWVAEHSLLGLRLLERPDAEALAWAGAIYDDFVRLADEELKRPTIAAAEVRAALAAAAAEWGRLRGASDPAAWSEAAAGWRTLNERYPEAYALYRQAQAALAGRDRAQAAEVLRIAAAHAAGMGARLLLGIVEDLARRARLDVGRAASDSSDEAARYGLTAREREVLALLARGYSDQRIAEELFISPKTASVHVSNVKGKLGVEHRIEAATIGLRLGLAAEEA